MDKWLKRALELAVQNVEEGGHPFGAVLVKEDRIVAEGVNELHLKHDVSGHAELVAIRKAQEEWETTDLSDCVMYASGEPCPMCMTAIYFSNIPKVIYAQSVEEAMDVGLSAGGKVYKELTMPKEKRSIEMLRQKVESPELDAMKKFAEKE
ncbi:nucleoside deaminase [Halobacillus fulvus]|nr:nucleoside deaminase [Halobacillus fulvus]